MEGMLHVVGYPSRFLLAFMPLTRRILVASARARHDVYVTAKYGGTPAESDARARHRRYVEAFYGHVA